jgi:hypothetical protein
MLLRLMRPNSGAETCGSPTVTIRLRRTWFSGKNRTCDASTEGLVRRLSGPRHPDLILEQGRSPVADRPPRQLATRHHRRAGCRSSPLVQRLCTPRSGYRSTAIATTCDALATHAAGARAGPGTTLTTRGPAPPAAPRWRPDRAQFAAARQPARRARGVPWPTSAVGNLSTPRPPSFQELPHERLQPVLLLNEAQRRHSRASPPSPTPAATAS